MRSEEARNERPERRGKEAAPKRPRRRKVDAVGVIGGGLVGLAVARQLAGAGVQVVVFEKEAAVAQHQSGHNSGVVHAGIYYRPGSAKAALCRRGAGLLRGYCADRGLPWDERGKLVVARDETETARLREIERRAAANGVPGLRWLAGPAIRELEPNITGQAALLSPATAITDYPAIARSFAGDVTAAGGQVLTSTQVSRVHRLSDDHVDVSTAAGPHRLSRLIICAGLQSDLMAAAAGDQAAPEIVPFRGEYLRLRPHARHRVRHLIYPVPDPAYPFLGVHLTPRIDGEVDIGPNAVLALAREGYRRRDISARQLARLARSVAFRKMARRNWRAGLREMRGSLSRRVFLAEARSYLPWLGPGDVQAAPAGVRAQAVDPDGSLVDDFRIHQIGPVTAVRNAPSPAATASLAIAERIIAELSLPMSTGR
jgi:L-2-hydroxyglutarate oxidase LhgO